MSIHRIKRILAGALLGAAASAAVVGTLLAQGVKPAAPVQAAQAAPAVGAQAPEWLRGRWAERCGAPQFVEIAADTIAEYRGATVAGRAEAAFAVAGDVVMVTIGRALPPGAEAMTTGMVIVLRRDGDGFRLIGFDDPRQPSRIPPREVMRRCS